MQARDAAGCNNRLASACHHVFEEFDVRTLQSAVFGDVGDHVARAARVLEASQHLPEVAALLCPATSGKCGATDVEPNSDGIAKAFDNSCRPGRIFKGSGAEVHARSAGFESSLKRCVIANATGELDFDGTGCRNYLAQKCAVFAATEGCVEIDQVDPFGTRVDPGHGGFDRVAVIGLTTGFALG